MWPVLSFSAVALALIVERFIGYPKPVENAIGHPVEWIGKLIAWLDKAFNFPQASASEAKLRGMAALAALMLAGFIPAWLLAKLLSYANSGWIVEALVATAFIAQKSLREHVRAVGKGLDKSLGEGRRTVSQIVGRDASQLDESGVARAALESLAENTSDGVVAPVLWYVALGLPGLVVYKAINTADSMIGHKSERYRYFGWAAARLDDLVNLPCSRLTGLLFAATSGNRFKITFDTMKRDAPKHQSPNAGWPEAALATALGLKFGGPRAYEGETVDLPWMGDGRSNLTRADISAGLKFYGRAMTLLWVLALACAVVF